MKITTTNCDYKALYIYLFNGITDIIDYFGDYNFKGDINDLIFKLELLQINCEEIFIKQGEKSNYTCQKAL